MDNETNEYYLKELYKATKRGSKLTVLLIVFGVLMLGFYVIVLKVEEYDLFLLAALGFNIVLMSIAFIVLRRFAIRLKDLFED